MQFLMTAGLAYGGPGSASKVAQRTADIENGHVVTVLPVPAPDSLANPRLSSSSYPTPPQSAIDVRQSAARKYRRHRRSQSLLSNVPHRANSEKRVKISGNRATSMMYTQMLFAIAGDKLVFGLTPSATSWIGSGLVLSGAIWVAAAKDKKTLAHDQNHRNGEGEETVALMDSSSDEDQHDGNDRPIDGLVQARGLDGSIELATFRI